MGGGRHFTNKKFEILPGQSQMMADHAEADQSLSSSLEQVIKHNVSKLDLQDGVTTRFVCGQNLLHTEVGAHSLVELFVYVLSGAKE